MPYFVIGNDKGFEEAYSADEIDSQMKTVNNAISTVNSNISTLQSNLNTTNNNVNSKQKKITSGTAAPSGGSNGDIYIQY